MSESVVSLAGFLLARIGEDEEVARAASHERWDQGIIRSGSPGRWRGIEAYAVLESIGENRLDPRMAGDEVSRSQSSGDVAHIARHDPARVLLECEAKRSIVEQYVGAVDFYANDAIGRRADAGDLTGLEFALRALASVFADHPDYRAEEWAV